jgi:hypothetical protein
LKDIGVSGQMGERISIFRVPSKINGLLQGPQQCSDGKATIILHEDPCEKGCIIGCVVNPSRIQQ